MKKCLLALISSIILTPAFAVTWTYQVNVNNKPGPVQSLDKGKKSFQASSYKCEATPVVVANKTEYRSVVCMVGDVAVSTGGLCTLKEAKSSSVQFAILNLTNAKEPVNVLVACKF